MLISFAIIGAAFTVPTVADDVPLVNFSLGLQYFEDFESGNGSLVHWAAPELPVASWEWGTPASGPGVAASGSHVWATDLDGAHLASECGAIVSPPIDLTSATSAAFSVAQWRHMQQSTFSSAFQNDLGLLFYSQDGGATWTKITAPTPGYDPGSGSTTARACLGSQPTGTGGYSGPPGTAVPGPTYTTVGAALPVGGVVQVAFAFGSDASTHRDGWFIDDFAVTIDNVTTVEDFEASEGGFVAQEWKPRAPTTSWEHGTPSVGPSGASNLWGTNLDGQFHDNECSYIETPAIDLTGLVDVDGQPANKATLRWQQWYQGSSSSTTGILQVTRSSGTVTTLVPDGGYPDQSVGTAQKACLGEDVTAGYGGVHNPTGTPLTDHAADLSGFLGDTITVRFFFATGTFNDEGWYIDNIEVESFVYFGEPHLPPLPQPGAPGWTSGGVSSSWAYGKVTDPSSDAPTDDTAWATNLAGSHNAAECSWIEAPPIPGALLATDPTLTFDNWYYMAFAFSATTATGGLVMASTDGGQNWTYVADDSYVRPPSTSTSYPSLRDCIASYGIDTTVPVYTGQGDTWDPVSMDLSAFAGPDPVQLRFLFGSHTTLLYEGWFVKNVKIGGVQVLP